MHHLSLKIQCSAWLGSFVKKLYPQQFSSGYLLLLVALSSSFFCLAWCSFWFGYLLFVAIVPMLLITQYATRVAQYKFSIHGLWYIFLTLFLWNSCTIWWIYKASFVGLLFVLCCNSLFLFFPWLFYYYMRKWGGIYAGYVGLVTAWLTLEYAHLSWEFWEFSFPWLNLGNGLAGLAPCIQWYEYTGILGGSFWILGINIGIYHLFFEKNSFFLLKVFFCWLLLPISVSLLVYCNYKEKGCVVEAVVVQPNFDSYTEKDCSALSFVPYADQINRLLTLSKQQLTQETALVVWPESAIGGWLNEALIHDYPLMKPILHFLEQYPNISLITGVNSLHLYGATPVTQTAQKRGKQYVDYFNSVFYLKAGKKVAIYHKEKRLPGGEYIPYFYLLPKQVLAWVKQKFADIGDIDPSLGRGSGSAIFTIDNQVKVVPINCYESVYGAFVGSALRKGANLLAVVTNDNWWGDTPVYHHHFQYSRLLAISHRSSLVRSANTGISGFINQRGDIIAATSRLTKTAMRQVVCANNQVTFYSLYGDYIGQIAAYTFLILFFVMFVVRLQHKKKLTYSN